MYIEVNKKDFDKLWKSSTKKDILTQFYFTHNDLRAYIKMWETLKEYIEQYENENEIAYIMQQIEEEYFKTGDDTN